MKNAILGFIAALILVGCISAAYITEKSNCYLIGYTKGYIEKDEIKVFVTKIGMTEDEFVKFLIDRTQKQAKECGCF